MSLTLGARRALGIVKDPFGAAQYLGATLPLDGYGIKGLSLSPDGKVLLGQLQGYFSARDQWTQQLPHRAGAWNVQQLIQAALGQSAQDRLRKHIRLPSGAEQLITSENGQPVAGVPAGTVVAGSAASFEVFEDWATAPPQATGLSLASELASSSAATRSHFRAGDVVTLDIAAFLVEEIKKDPSSERSQLILNQLGKTSDELEAKHVLSELKFKTGILSALTKRTTGDTEEGQVRLATKDGLEISDGNEMEQAEKLLSADPTSNPNNQNQLVSSGEKKFSDTGVVVLFREISNKDLNTLRTGGNLSSKFVDLELLLGEVDLAFRVQFDDYQKGAAVLVGDRPLENPGYSALKLSHSAVIKNDGSNHDRLDVLRIEQRLAYLGFTAMRTGSDNSPQNILVDGDWGGAEARAALMFHRVVNYNASTASQYVSAPHGKNYQEAVFSKAVEEAANRLEIKEDQYKTDDIVDGLNAYNAPHWMQLFPKNSKGAGLASDNINMPSWVNKQDGLPSTEQSEMYASSWVRDLMRAYEYANQNLRQNVSKGLIFNGTTDGNLKITPKAHATHDLGMAMDLGFSEVYIAKVFQTVHDTRTISVAAESLPEAQRLNRWSTANAVNLVAQLTSAKPTDPDAARLNGNYNQAAALSQFLALYSLTQNTSGDWGNIALVHGDAGNKVRTALFGAGDRENSIISSVLIGRNDEWVNKKNPTTGVVERVLKKYNGYDAMRQVLTALGVSNKKLAPHENHFHIAFKPPKLQGIESTSAVNALAAAPVAAQAAQAAKPRVSSMRFVACDMLDGSSTEPGDTRVNIATMFNQLRQAGVKLTNTHLKEAMVEIVQQPAKGVFTVAPSGLEVEYRPADDWRDHIDIDKTGFLRDVGHVRLVVGGVAYRVKVEVAIAQGYTPDAKEIVCPNGYIWRISEDLSPEETLRSPLLAGSQTQLDRVLTGFEAANFGFAPLPQTPTNLLPTLLHEHAHVLGLARREDLLAFLGGPDALGNFPLPTTEQLHAMAALATARNQAADSAPSPWKPLQALAGLPLLMGLRRGSGGSAAQTGEGGKEANTNTTTAANPAAIAPENWLTRGTVTAGQGGITLAENAREHTQLAQQFNLQARDRFLSFTLAGAALQANAKGPHDAFEVALRSASTGLPVGGTVALSRSDALLNLQTDGTERLGAGVRKQLNADGSATYFVDLPAALAQAGSPVQLSFDLLGFGAATSGVTLRDIRLLSDPVATDDTALLDEDTAHSAQVLDNDLLRGARQAPRKPPTVAARCPLR